MIVAVAFGQRDLVLRAYRSDDGCADMLCPLAEDQPDAAGGGMKQDGFARFHLIGPRQQILHRHAFQQRCGGGVIGNIFRQLHQLVRGDVVRLRIGADRARIGDAIAFLQRCHAITQRFDDAGRFAAKPCGQRQFVETRAVIGVDEVHADGGVAHADLAGRGWREFHLLITKNIGTAGFMDSDRLHLILLVRGGCRSDGCIPHGCFLERSPA